MLIQKKSKYTKYQKKVFKKRTSLSGFVQKQQISLCQFAIKATRAGIISSKLIEEFRRTLTRNFSRSGKIWIKIFPNIGITKKPLEVRQGKGKGNVQFHAASVKAGQILFEIEGVSFDLMNKSVTVLQKKSPIPLKLEMVHQ
jgi:large subunit ribosomal protein L16